jgi:glycosyltransferase involved in cell wall biosynthesis
LRAEKRLDRLVRALAPEPSCRSLTLVGDGPENERLARLAAELDVRDKVLLVGARADVRPALARADLFAMTSETEQMPNALLQAMSMSLPVVAHEAGDIWEILPDVQRPFVSPQGDLGRLAEAVRVLAHRPDRRQALAAANRVRVRETYPMNAMVNRYRELYALAAEAA